MRHTPCGCRSAHLVEVRSNSRLPPVSTMRRAKQCRYFASSLPPSKRHSRLTIVRRGCNRERLAEDSWRSHVHRTYIAQRVQLFKLQTRNVGGRGGLPSPFSWGSKGDILFLERGYPPYTPKRKDEGSPPRPPTLAVCSLNNCTRCAVWVRCTWLRHESLRFVTSCNRALLS